MAAAKVTIYCPLLKSSGCRSPLHCIYVCKTGTKIKCSEYTKKFELLCALLIEQNYLDKYGAPTYPKPLALRRRRRIHPLT